MSAINMLHLPEFQGVDNPFNLEHITALLRGHTFVDHGDTFSLPPAEIAPGLLVEAVTFDAPGVEVVTGVHWPSNIMTTRAVMWSYIFRSHAEREHNHVEVESRDGFTLLETSRPIDRRRTVKAVTR